MTTKQDPIDQLVLWACRMIQQRFPKLKLTEMYLQQLQLQRFVKYTLVAGVGYLMVLALGYAFIDVLGSYWMIGGTAATVIAHLIKFILQESWIYHAKAK